MKLRNSIKPRRPSGSIAAQYLDYKGEGVAAGSLIQRTCAQIGLVEGVNCAPQRRRPRRGLAVEGSALGTQDPTYGGSTNTPGVGSGLDGVPDIGFFNTVNPTSTSQSQYNGRLDANMTVAGPLGLCHLLGAAAPRPTSRVPFALPISGIIRR